MTYVTQEVKDLYHLLEHEFLPLDLASEVQPLLTKILKVGGKISSASSVPEVQLSQYVPALENLATLRLLKQVSHVYQTMKIECLAKMVPFSSFSAVEKLSVDAAKHNFVAMKVDHLKGAVISTLGLESDGLRDHLSLFVASLNKSRAMMYPTERKISKLGELLPSLGEVVDKEHKRLLARKSIIEKRKEEQERHFLELEREEESKRLKLQKISEEAEQKRLASEYEQRKNQRILREIEERELEEAQALLQEAEKRGKKKGKKPLIEGEKVTKQSLMELALSEQLKGRQEMEKRLQKLGKTMDHLERAKREEAAPLIEAAFQRRLSEEKVLHEHEQQQEIELRRLHHDGDLKEKNRLLRILENKEQLQNKVVKCWQNEYERLRVERVERNNQILRAHKDDRETKRKMLYLLSMEEERLKKLQEARKIKEAERLKKEEAEKRARLDKIAEIQRQREQEIEERRRASEGLARSSEHPSGSRPLESPDAVPEAAPTAAAAPTPGKYVPRFRRAEGKAPPPEPDRWGSGRQDDRVPPPGGDRWRSGGGQRSSGAAWIPPRAG